MKWLIFCLISFSALSQSPRKVCPDPSMVKIGHMCPGTEVQGLKTFIPAAGQILTKDNYPLLWDFYKSWQYHFCNEDLSICKNVDLREMKITYPPKSKPTIEYYGEPFWYIRAE